MLVLPDYEIATILHEDRFTCVYRGVERQTQRPVILKTLQDAAPAPHHLARLRYEYTILNDLDTPGVARPYALVEHQRSLVLVEEDIGGVALSTLITQGPCPLDRFFSIAIALTDILDYVHRHQIIHRDIKPSNILLSPLTDQVQLIDFGLASRLSREHPQLTPPSRLEGSLPYLAPEQTGRMNRAVDYRADFYALGMTFYELLTGQLPFEAQDALEWVHCHIARTPPPPCAIAAGIPIQLCDLVLKLLAKLAEDRYQSTRGLAADLAACQHQWAANGVIMPFVLGTNDISDRFQLPQKLYGRAHEVASMLQTFGRVAASGQPELVMVTGYSGIGKSALVAELHKPIVAQRGYFLSGKFDQYRRDIPYAPISAAFHNLIQQLLAESDERVAAWRQRLLAAVGDSGQIMIDLIPQVQLVIGPQPAVPELPPDQAMYRLYRVFQQFVSALTAADSPLVLFLDDLQWVDPASLNLLTHLCAHPAIHYLLVIGAYRDNEVTPTAPVILMLDDLRKRSIPIQTLTLAPLAEGDVAEILADALHDEYRSVAPLAQLIYTKTRGNPFFSFQFITALYQDGLLAFRPEQRRWSWDLTELQARHFTENVVELMLSEVQRLPLLTQQVLALAGFLGNQFELVTLARVSEQLPSVTQTALWPALQVGLVMQFGQSYRFLHDRVQEAAYTLTAPSERAAVHARIGRLLLQHTPEEAFTARLFDIVTHLNKGALHLTDPAERRRVAQLNQRAGAKARASFVYVTAAGYLAAGIALLPDQPWSDDYALTFELYLARADCEYLAGKLAVADALLDIILAAAHDVIDRAKARLVRIRLLMMRGDHDTARSVALASLHELGLDIPAQPTAEHVRQAYADIEELMTGRTIESLIDLPPASDPSMQMAIHLMMSITTATYFAAPIVWALHAPTMLLLNLRHGNSVASPMVYTFFGFELAAGRQRFDDGYRFCQMAYILMERLGVTGQRGNLLSHWSYTAAWVQPLDKVLEMLRETIPAAIENGDLIVASTASHHVVLESLVKGVPLDELLLVTERGLAMVAQSQYQLMDTIIRPRRQLIHMLCGRTASLSSLSDDSFDERAFEAALANDPLMMGVCCYYITRLLGHVVVGDYAAAYIFVQQAEPLLWSVTGTLDHYLFVFYAALTLAACYPAAAPEQQAQSLITLQAHQEQLRIWAMHNAETFGSSHLLVSAEIACIGGQELAAQQYYEQAIKAARVSGLVQQEALANELAARYYRQHELLSIADMYLREARACYDRWGASGKVRQLEERSPQLHEINLPTTARTSSTSLAQLDVQAIVKATQAITGQIMPDQLVQTLLQVVLEQAGADRGALLLADGEDLRLAATAQVVQHHLQVAIAIAPTPQRELPESILAYMRRSHEHVLLQDALDHHPFATDPYLLAQRPRSVLGVPILRQGVLAGILYLEHRTITHVFTADRLLVLEQLAAQAAISLENTQFYAQLAEQNQLLEQRVAERTAQLEQANSELKATNKDLEAFAFTASHDLRSPLQVIDGYTTMLLEDYSPVLDAEGRRMGSVILHEITRMNQLIADLLAFARFARAPLEVTTINMNWLVADTFSEVIQLEDPARIEFQCDSLPPAVGDPSLLRQVWVNLLSNAVKYSSKRARAIVQIGGSQADGVTTYRVQDNGAGFDMRAADKLFAVFQRLHSHQEFPGTGVGLATTQRIITRHGGTIWAESEPNQGATFFFTLPITFPATYHV